MRYSTLLLFAAVVSAQVNPFFSADRDPVLGSPVTGRAAPLTPLHTLAGTLTCRFLPQPANARTLYAGLAPGMIGIYQTVFQMPDDVGEAPLNELQCS